MSLLREIQDAAQDSNVGITDLLRKCMVLAARLENEQFKDWVSQELKGYKNGSDLPDYRSISVASYGDFFFDSGGGPYQNLSIPTRPLPDDIRTYSTAMSFRDSISALDHLVKICNDEGFAKFPWPPELVEAVGNILYKNMRCVYAWRVVPNHIILSMIDSVKTRILEFVLEIEKVDPSVGEVPPDSKPGIAPERVSQLFYTVVMGNVVGNQFNYHLEVHQGDLESLKEYLLNLGIDIQPSDLQDLESALTDDKIEEDQNGIGSRTKGWIERVKDRASAGAGGISVGVTADLIAKAVSMYLFGR